MITGGIGKEAYVLFGRTQRAILSLLFTHPGESFYLRQIVRLTGAGLGPVQRELKKLTQSGIISRSKSGQQVYYRANDQSSIYDELKSIIVKTVGLADELRSALQPLASKIDTAYIYGSFAAGTEHSKSDIDLMIVGNVTLREIVGAVSGTGRKLARMINPTVLRPMEYEKGLTEPDGFVQQVHSGPKIVLIGGKNES